VVEHHQHFAANVSHIEIIPSTIPPVYSGPQHVPLLSVGEEEDMVYFCIGHEDVLAHSKFSKSPVSRHEAISVESYTLPAHHPGKGDEQAHHARIGHPDPWG
jgi:hypothetical protein